MRPSWPSGRLITAEPVPAAFASPLDLLLQALEPVLDIACLARVEAAPGPAMEPLFNAAGIVTKPVRHAVTDPVAPIETVDLPLDVVEPQLKFANLAIAIAIPIAGSRTLPSWIVLRCCGAGSGK
jgi:hypothetical protein